MIENSKYQAQYDNLNLLDSKMYDNLFPQNVRNNALDLIVSKRLHSFKKVDTNIYEAIATGTYNYSVRVELNDDLSFKGGSCECAYYNNTDSHCKHVYALLKMILALINSTAIQKKYDENIFELGRELEKLNIIITESEVKKIDVLIRQWINGIHNQMSQDYRNSSGIRIAGMNELESIKALEQSLFLLNRAKEHREEVEKTLTEENNQQ